jgi:formyltetrahydrofolate-dependent phosphoribosylglycinamide formyltransferase
VVSPRLAVLVSGSGTILESILADGIHVDVVLADRPCRGLELATAAGIPAAVVNRGDFGGFTSSFDREAYSLAVVDTLRHHEVNLIAMAGFGTITSGAFHEAFPGVVLNTHPSLLPDFKGWHAVRDALAAGVTVTGCTVHVATEELDEGPILAQREVAVEAGDTEESLQERIKQTERLIYPEVIRAVLVAMESGHAPNTVSL